MASITIRNLDEAVKSSLRERAARHGRSMEEEARQMLALALDIPSDEEVNLAEFIRRRFEPLGGVELEPLPRQSLRAPPTFD